MSIANEPARILDSSAASVIKPRATRMAVRVVLLLLAAICAGFILRETIRYSVQVPFWDQWDYVSDYQRYEKGEIPFSAFLLAGAGEHLSVVQDGCSILLWRLTGMNLRLIMVLDWLLAVGLVVLMALIARQALPRGSLVPWAILSTSSFFVFNPGAYQFWLWGIPHHYTIVAFLFLAAAFCAQIKLSVTLKILIAAVAATLASSTLGSGMLLWGLFPVVLAACVPWRELLRRRVAIAVYGLLGLMMTILYIHNLLSYKQQAPTATKPVTLFDLASFFLAYTGNLVFGFPSAALISWEHAMGAILLIFLGLSTVAALKSCRGKPEWTAMIIWLCLAAYELMAGGLVALTRHTFGLGYLVAASRYVLSTSFLPVAIIAIAMVAVRAFRSRLPGSVAWYSGLLCTVTAFLAICAVIRVGQTPADLASFRFSYKGERNGKVAMAAANLVNVPEYRNIYPHYPDLASFSKLSTFITQKGGFPPMWDDGFVRKLASTAVNPKNNDGFVDSFAVQADKLSLSGWAYLRKQRKTADAVIILAVPHSGQPKILTVAFPSLIRPDVAATVRNPDASDTGWTADIPRPLPEAGTVIRCFAYEADSGLAYPLLGDRSL